MASAGFYSPVGPRTCGLKSNYTKQRMKDHEAYMTGYGGGKAGHKFNATPSGAQYVVKQTTWMDMRLDAGWGNWFKKMQGRVWRRTKYMAPPFAVGFAMIFGTWEICVWESQRYEKQRWH
eukprot:TRINITY_DN2556_c0_g1_i1.p1 TRINITY_DN2556_c0_g1~~TRINITY_DN2556_c0_g1_i1.p1  ORF type:complete len:120 (+),score=20.80 TRINITY_DN2556_c0_g1_i1:58-417(+)